MQAESCAHSGDCDVGFGWMNRGLEEALVRVFFFCFSTRVNALLEWNASWSGDSTCQGKVVL